MHSVLACISMSKCAGPRIIFRSTTSGLNLWSTFVKILYTLLSIGILMNTSKAFNRSSASKSTFLTVFLREMRLLDCI